MDAERYVVAKVEAMRWGEFSAEQVELCLNRLPADFCLHTCEVQPDGSVLVIAERDDPDDDPECDDDPDDNPDDGETLPFENAA